MPGAGSRMTNLFDENPHSATVRYRADILFLRLARSVWAWARCPDSTRQPSMRPSSPTSQVINRILSQRWVMVRSEEHTSELQSLMRISYAVFCLKKKNKQEGTTNSLVIKVHEK